MRNWRHIIGSSNVKPVFEGIQYWQVPLLLKIIDRSELKTREYIQKQFSERSKGFSETLTFSVRLNLVLIRGQNLESSVVFRSMTADDIRVCIQERLLRIRNRYRSELFRYIRQFAVSDGQLVYRSSMQRRSRESAVRNFLMGMGIVKHDSIEDWYIIGYEHICLYSAAIDNSKQISPSSLAKLQVNRNDLGLAAEEAVFQYEKDRVGPDMINEIDHVALRNVAAGYDIRSITRIEGSVVVPRYIEVKVVSGQSYKFYWSRNEVNVSVSFGEWYYLYLLPVDKSGSFNISQMQIIPDPNAIVLGPRTAWVVEPDVLCCYLSGKKSKNQNSSGVSHHV